jgi:hypothetical protein
MASVAQGGIVEAAHRRLRDSGTPSAPRFAGHVGRQHAAPGDSLGDRERLPGAQAVQRQQGRGALFQMMYAPQVPTRRLPP